MVNSRLMFAWFGCVLVAVTLGLSWGEFAADLWCNGGTVFTGGYSIAPCVLWPVICFCYIVSLKQDVDFCACRYIP